MPKDEHLLKSVNSAAQRLHMKLCNLNIDRLGISDYGKRYLRNKTGDMGATLQRYVYILTWSLAYQIAPKERLTFIDYGGGPGLLALLAKEAGVGKVIYNDVYDVSCRDSRILGREIGNEADYCIEGGIDDLIGFLKKNALLCDAIASYDVIEHVYDVEDFMRKTCFLSTKPFSVVMSSGANPYNPLIKRQIIRKHFELEYKDRSREPGHKERDCLRAYFMARKEIILRCAPELSHRETDLLASMTRGLMYEDIRKYLDDYLKAGKKPTRLGLSTNTCDPFTGNWAEHLMDLKCLVEILARHDFNTELRPGYYPQASNDLRKRFLAYLLNPIVKLLKDKGLFLSPFYTIYGRKPGSRSIDV